MQLAAPPACHSCGTNYNNLELGWTAGGNVLNDFHGFPASPIISAIFISPVL